MKREAAPSNQRISYVIGTYPSLTTTFIDREVSRLLERGVDVAIVSIRRPHTDLSPEQRALQARVRYLLPPRWPRLAAGILRAVMTRPRSVASMLVFLVTRPHGDASRLRTLLHVITGIYAAHVLGDRPRVHVHAHFVDRAAVVAMVASRLLRATYSVTAHANDIYVQPVLLREKIGRAAFAVTCTEYNRRHLAETIGEPASRRLIRIYHGVDLDALQPGPAAELDAGLRGETPTLLSVGQLKPKKGLGHLIDAIAELSGSWPDLACEIVGDGPLHGELSRQIRDRGLADRVRLVGAVPHASVVERYARRPIFVLPCVVASDGDRDGIPNVILEAMAMELAVVSTAISGIPEVVHDGATGLLVSPGDVAALAQAIDRLVRDAELRRTLGRAAREFVTESFDRRRNVDRFLAAVPGA